MVSAQPILDLRHFQLRENRLPQKIKRLLYLSWEDVLWDLLSKKKIPKGSYILTPDFFCRDVEKNIRMHGYRLKNYKIGRDLTADKKDFENKIDKFKPRVIIIFHPVGIKSNLTDAIPWLKKITGESILIEDSVHRVVDPTKVKIIKKDHFVIDSLRKVVPLQGASLYGRVKDLNFRPPPFHQSFIYSVRVNVLWFLMIIFWTFSNYSRGKLSKILAGIAEKLMLRGYDLIGDSASAARGGVPAEFLSRRININKIQNIKMHQVTRYESELGKTLPVKLYIPDGNKKHLRGFPVILPTSHALKTLRSLRKGGLLVRFELDDSLWSQKQKIIYLPLGIQMGIRQQDEVCALTRAAILRAGA